jgi:hypothetical protein
LPPRAAGVSWSARLTSDDTGFFLHVMFGAMRRLANGTEAVYAKEALGGGEAKLPGFREVRGTGEATDVHWTHQRFGRLFAKWEDRLRSVRCPASFSMPAI